jgi:hypothetical protein
MRLSRELTHLLIVIAALALLPLLMNPLHVSPLQEGIDNPSDDGKCTTRSDVLPFQNAGNVAALQTQMTALQSSTTQAVSGYSTLEDTTKSLGTRLTKTEEELEKLQASIKKSAKMQTAKVKEAQSQLDKFDVTT